MPPAVVVGAMAEAAASSVGGSGEEVQGEQGAGDGWAGTWTEDRMVALMKEHAEKSKKM